MPEPASQQVVEYVDRAAPPPAPPTTPNDLNYYQDIEYHWLYSSPSYGWWHFSKNDNNILEDLYRSGQRQGTLQIGHNAFTVDFAKMQQYGSGKPRHMLRTTTLGDIVLKGVAGSRIAKRDILANSVDQSHFGVSKTPIVANTVDSVSELDKSEETDIYPYCLRGKN
jgi:hypothetical protein